MTVRAWFTISGLVIAALFVAVAFRFFAPASAGPPAIIGRAGGVRLDGERLYTCWPQRSGPLKCQRGKADPGAELVPAEGTLRFVVAYPVAPDTWQVTVAKGTKTALFKKTNKLKYRLEPGTYMVDTQARYKGGAFIHYIFRFRITRSGS